LKAGGLSTAFDVGGIFGSPLIGIFLGKFHLLCLFASNIFTPRVIQLLPTSRSYFKPMKSEHLLAKKRFDSAYSCRFNV
jgi:hypothetical protein